jgi:hypothetical protein
MKAVCLSVRRRNKPGADVLGKGDTAHVPYAETREDAERQKRAFQAWCGKKEFGGGRAATHVRCC